MKLARVIKFLDNLVFSKIERHLKEVEIVVLTGAWEAKTYEQIAKNSQYSLSYIKQAAAPRLWKILSEILEENISKTNFRGVIEELQQASSIDTDSLSSSSDKRAVRDWNHIPENSFFYGRTEELKTLRKWSLEDRCRLIVIVGMGGIGKTALSIRCARKIQHEFKFVIWQQLTNPNGLRKILIELIQMTGDRQENLTDDFNGQIDTLLENLRRHRCLIVLDTSPAIFLRGNSAKEDPDYEQLLKRLGQEQHQSCFISIAREKPREVALIEGDTLPTRTLHLKGMNPEAAKDIFRAKGLSNEEKWKDLIDIYCGNPLALKIVANTIKELFGGKVATFLKQKTIIFGELNDLLDEQFESISPIEEQILYWLVVNRQSVSLSELRSQMIIPVATAKLIEALESLLRNSFIARNIVADEVKFSLELPVVIQYVTNRISDRLCEEISTVGKNKKVEQLFVLKTLNLQPDRNIISSRSEYFLVHLVLNRLAEIFQDENSIEQQLAKIMSLLPENNFLAVGYAKDNLKILLAELKAYFKPRQEFQYYDK